MPGPGVGEALKWVEAELKAIKVRASSDPAKVNPPGAWLDVTECKPINLGDAWDVSVNVVLVAPAGTPAAAWQHLDRMVEVVQGRLVQRAGENLEVVTLVLPGSATQLPALIYPIQVFTP